MDCKYLLEGKNTWEKRGEGREKGVQGQMNITGREKEHNVEKL